jgi:hypothetical protein
VHLKFGAKGEKIGEKQKRTVDEENMWANGKGVGRQDERSDQEVVGLE